jgi:hypothetical protein
MIAIAAPSQITPLQETLSSQPKTTFNHHTQNIQNNPLPKQDHKLVI